MILRPANDPNNKTIWTNLNRGNEQSSLNSQAKAFQ